MPALSFSVVSDTVISAMVGNGATGSVSISSPQGSSTLAGFTFKPLPVIFSFAPTSGPVGTTVTISGNNFDSIPANDIVFFGAVKAQVISASQNVLTVKAPVGATYQPITVSTRSLTAYANQPFILTFGQGGIIESNSFGDIKNFVCGLYADGLSVGDLDGDGKIDVAFVNLGYNTFSVLRNTTTTDTIGFAQRKQFTVFSRPRFASIGDLNGDGNLDAAIGNGTAGSFNFIGNSMNGSIPGNISFGGVKTYAMANTVDGVAIADLDGDGRPDIAATNSIANVVSIFRNTRAGAITSFASKIDFTSGKGPQQISIADIDGDGKPDLVIANFSDNTFSVLRNTSTIGAISFAPKIDFATGAFPFSILTGDLDKDGKPDVIVAGQNNNIISIIKNTSTPGTIAFAPKTDYSIGTSGFSIGDLDGDGKPDLAFATSTGVSILKNTSADGTVSFAPRVDYPTPKTPIRISIADFDGDGKPDLVFINQLDTTLSILKNQITPGPQPVITSFAPTAAKSGDTVSISGANLTTTASVNFGGVNASSFDVVSDSLVTAIVANGASGTIAITTSYGIATKDSFVFIPPAPVIQSFTPDSAKSGIAVTINGKYFTNAISVSFGHTSAISFTVVSDSVITAIVGNGASGNIIVTSAYGSDTISGFKFIEPLKIPVISSFTPDSAGTRGIITINGKNFTTATSVSFGDTAATSFTVVSDSVITAIVGNGASGNIIVTTPNGSDTIDRFTFVPKSSVSSFVLMRFGGTLSGNQAQLSWQTENEETISFFIIERGPDSSSFSAIGSLKASGDTGVHNYMYTDSLPQYKDNYYRLAMVDTAGNLTYSNIIDLTLNVNPQAIKLYPNPAKGYVSVVNPASSAPAKLELVDISGRVVKVIQISPNVVINTLDLGGVIPGVYSVVWTDGAKKLTQQLFVNQ